MKKLIALSTFLVLALLLGAGSWIVTDTNLAGTDLGAAVIKSALVDLTNKNRKAQKVSLLKTNPVLEQAAVLKAQDMAVKGYFAHVSPEGKDPWYWLDQVGYNYSYAGENLAINFFDSADVADAWMKSPAHRANIVNKNFKEIGIALARGIYRDQETVFVVQFLGAPVKTSPSAIPTALKARKDNLSSAVIKSLYWLGNPFVKAQVEVPQDGQNASIEKAN